MIPMSLDVVLKYKDEKEKITYLLKPMTDLAELSIRRLQRNTRKGILPFVAEAEKIISQEKKEWGPGEKEAAIRSTAIELSSKDFGSNENDEEELSALNNLIDNIVLGWETDRTDILSFPEDKKPSKLLTVSARWFLYGKIMELNTITGEEAKN